MTSPERRYTVIYRAIADYADLIRKTREVRSERRAMHADEVSGSTAASKANKAAEDSEKLRIQSTRALGEESKKSAGAVQDAYDIARDSIQDITKSVDDLGTSSDNTDSRIKRMLDRFRGISLNPAKAAEETLAPTHAGNTEPPVGAPKPDLLPGSAARDTEDVASALHSVGNESDTTQSKLQSFFSNVISGMRSLKKDTQDEADSLEDIVSHIRDTSNDYIPRHGDLPSGRHRAIDIGGGGGGGGGGGSSGGGADKAGDSAKKAVKAFDDLLGKLGPVAAKFLGIASAIAPLIGALGSLGGLVVGAATEFGNLTGVVAAIPGLFAAAGTGIAALVVGIMPMMNIFKAFQQSQKASAQAAADNGKAQKDAAQAVKDARLGEANAEISVKEAEISAQRATENLTKARRDAARALEDLRDAANSDKLAEEDASLSYAEAVDNYKKVMADPNATLLERERALLQVKQADAARSDQAKKSRRDQEDLTDAEKKGVEGSNQVVDAKLAQQRAYLQLQTSTNDLHKSIDTLNQALHVQKNGGTVASNAIDQLNQLLKSASPSTRAFAKGLIEMNKPILDIQKNTSEALFKPLVGQLGNIKSLLPTVSKLLTDAAGAIGDVAAKGIAMISSGPWKADFATISKNNVGLIKTLGDAALHVADAFRNITIAAGPFTQWIASAIDRMAKGFDDFSKKARDGGGLAAFLTNTEKSLSQAWVIIKNFGAGIYSLFKASQDFTGWLMDRIEKLSGRFRDWSKAQEDPTSRFQTWLKDIEPTLTAIGALIGAVATAFGHMASDPKNLETANHLLGILKEDILPPIQRILDSLGQNGVLDKVGAALGVILDSIAEFLAGGGSGGLQTFVSVLSGFFSTLSWFLKIPGVVPVLTGVFAALGAFAALRMITKLPILSQLIDGMSWIIKNKTGFAGALADLPALLARAVGLGGSSPTSAGDKSNRNAAAGNDSTRWRTLFTKFDRKIALEVEMNAWLEKILVAIDRLRINGGLSSNRPDIDINDPNHESHSKKPNVPAGEVEKIEEDIAKSTSKWGKFGKVLGGTADAALSIFAGVGFSDIKNIIPGLKSKPSVPAATSDAARAASTAAEDTAKPGILSRLWNAITGQAGSHAGESGTASAAGKAGRFAASGGRLAALADPLDWIGLATGVVADSVWTGKNRQKPGAQLTRAGGAVLTGAGIGAGVGTMLFPGVGTVIGGAVGAAAGGAYSLYKDPGLRRTVGNAASSAVSGVQNFLGGKDSGAVGDIGKVIGFIPTKLGDAGKALKEHLVGPLTDFFTKSLPGFLGKIPAFFTTTIPHAVGGFFTQTLPGLFNQIGTFFTQLPGKVLEFIGKVAFDVQYFVTKQIPDFFTKTIPHWFDSVKESLQTKWNDVEDFFTQDVPHFFTRTIPRWWGSITGSVSRAWNGVENFFTKSVPQFFTRTIPSWWHSLGHSISHAWGNVENFFTKSVPNFFTKTIPHWFTAIGHGVTNAWHRTESFFTKDVPNFFTKTIPSWFHNVVNGVKSSWNAVAGFFTKDVPDFFTKTVPGWFSGIGHAVYNNTVKPIADFFGGAWDFIKKHLAKGYNDEKQTKEDANNELGHADGGEVTGTFNGRQDTVSRRLTPGEFVIKRSISQQPVVKSFLRGLNKGDIDITTGAASTLNASAMATRALGLDGLNAAARSATSVGAVTPDMMAASQSATGVSASYDNSRSSHTNFGDINVYNPQPERTSTSLRRQVESLAYRTDDDERG